MTEITTGILKRGRGGAVLINAVQQPARLPAEVGVPARLLQEYALVEGASVTGPVAQGRSGRELAGVNAVCGLPPAAYRARTPFSQLVAVDPTERFHLGASGDSAMRRSTCLRPSAKARAA